MSIKNLEACWFPLGEVLYDYYHGNMAAHLVVKSNIEPDRHVPAGAFFREKNKFPKLEKTALNHCNGRVLDAGAGAGSHTLYLQKKGLQTHALDISRKAVEVMNLRGVEHAFAADLFAYNPQEKYDTVLLMMNGIGLAGTLDGLAELLKHLKTLLVPNGQLIFDTTDIAYVDDASRAKASLKGLEAGYYGTVYYQLVYKNRASEVYPWLYLDKETLQHAAIANGYWMEILAEEDDQYVVKLSVA